MLLSLSRGEECFVEISTGRIENPIASLVGLFSAKKREDGGDGTASALELEQGREALCREAAYT